MREIASPTFRSGSEPTSSATIESIAVAAFFLRSILDCWDARVPTTLTWLTGLASSAAGVCVSWARAALAATSEASAIDTAALSCFGRM
jgi:hypothetical protein